MAGEKNSATNMEMGSMSKVRTVVVINQRKSLESALTYLERNYYDIVLVHKMPDLIRSLQIHRPQVVLVSWNLRNTDVKRVYQLLTQKFHLACLVFAEDSTTRTTAALMSSGIPNAILAPVSGPSIHMKIQSLLAPKLRGRKKAVAPEFVKETKKFVNEKEVPQGVTWEKTSESSDSEIVWRGSAVKGEESTVYFFKGPEAPKYDTVKQEWAFKGSKGGIYIQERVKEREYSTIAEGMDPDSGIHIIKGSGKGKLYQAEQGSPEELHREDHQGNASADHDSFDWDNALKSMAEDLKATQKDSTPDSPVEHDEAPKEIPAKKKTKVMVETGEEGDSGNVSEGEKNGKKLGDIIEFGADIRARNPQAGESILAQALRAAVLAYDGVKIRTKAAKSQNSKMTVCNLNTPRFVGYMVCVSDDNNFQKLALADIMSLLQHELSEHGEEFLTPCEILEVEVEAVPFGPWAENKADFSIYSKKSGLSFAFFSTNTQPHIIAASHDSVLGISLENDVAADVETNFGLYIYLPKNDKYLLYLQKGQVFSKKMILKFTKFGVKTVYIRKSEKEAFLAYCAKNFIQSTLK